MNKFKILKLATLWIITLLIPVGCGVLDQVGDSGKNGNGNGSGDDSSSERPPPPPCGRYESH